MRRTLWRVLVGAVALAAATGAPAATPDARAAYRATLKKIASDESAARVQCRALSGHKRRLCFAEAEADTKKAVAAAEADYRGTPHARRNAKITAANANYAVERVKCAAKSGDERRECVKVARTMQSDAIRDATMAPK